MSGQLLPYPIETDANYAVQLAMRPIQLWEVVFPKDCLGRVLKTIHYQPPLRKDLRFHMAALRKILNAKKLPKIDLTKEIPMAVMTEYVGVYPIGIKEDKNIWTEGKFKGGEQL